MSKEKHTQGPWKYAPNDDGTWQVFTGDDPVDDVWVATINANYGDERLVESEGNIRLIAAAPDLLAACKQALTCPALNMEDLEPFDVETVDRLIKAIDKAETGE